MSLNQRAFSFWSERFGRWVVEAGEFVVEAGRHSRDLALAETVSVDAPSLCPPLSVDSTLQEWVADPIGRQLLAEAAEQGAPDALADPELVTVIGSMPMLTLGAFGEMVPSTEVLEALLSKKTQ